MCDPITAIMGAIGVGSALFGGSRNQQAAAPPPVQKPELTPFAARQAGADVKVGDTAPKEEATATPNYDGFSEKRTFGKPLGGLGRGGLGL